MVLEAAKHAYANKPKEYDLSETWIEWLLMNVLSVLSKGKSAILLHNSPEVVSSASDKAKLFAENLSKNCNVDDLVSLYLLSLLELMWKGMFL